MMATAWSGALHRRSLLPRQRERRELGRGVGARPRRLALGIAVDELGGVRPDQQREAHQLLHHVDDAVVVGRGLHPAVGAELLEGLGDARLVRDGEHPHPAPEQAQAVHGVEALRAARDLHDGERAALRRPHRAEAERQVVDLRLHQPGDLAVALGAAPDHALGPDRVLAQLVDRRMVVAGDLVGKRQVRGVEDPHLGAEVAQEPRGLLGGEPRVGALPERAVEQQDARRVVVRAEAEAGPAQREARVERRKVVGIGERAQACHRATSRARLGLSPETSARRGGARPAPAGSAPAPRPAGR